jgi:hypothetical protein
VIFSFFLFFFQQIYFERKVTYSFRNLAFEDPITFCSTLIGTPDEKRKYLNLLFTEGYGGFVVIPAGSQKKVPKGTFFYLTPLPSVLLGSKKVSVSICL